MQVKSEALHYLIPDGVMELSSPFFVSKENLISFTETTMKKLE